MSVSGKWIPYIFLAIRCPLNTPLSDVVRFLFRTYWDEWALATHRSERKHFFLWKVFVHPHLEVFISVACKLSVDLVSTRPPFVYSCLKNFINDLIELVPVCTWFGWLLHISFTCQSPLIYVPSAKLLLSKNGATELSSKSSYWLNYSKTSWYVLGCIQTDEFISFCPYPLLVKPAT